jgi:hypothetical protein
MEIKTQTGEVSVRESNLQFEDEINATTEFYFGGLAVTLHTTTVRATGKKTSTIQIRADPEQFEALKNWMNTGKFSSQKHIVLVRKNP